MGHPVINGFKLRHFDSVNRKDIKLKEKIERESKFMWPVLAGRVGTPEVA